MAFRVVTSSMHKLAAGLDHGYLTRQIALDATRQSGPDLCSSCTARGEAAGYGGTGTRRDRRVALR